MERILIFEKAINGVLNYYNNHQMHSSTKAVLNRGSIEIKSKVLDNIENVITKKEQNDIELELLILFYLKINSYLKTI